MAKYFKNAFAKTGDKEAVPDDSISTLVSYETGYTPEYELNPDTDPNGNYVGRRRFNQLFADTTENIKQWQDYGYPEFVADDGTGSPLSYQPGRIVYHSGAFYQANTTTNTAPPSAQWDEVSLYGKTAVFDSVDEMVASDALVIGMSARTLGYYTPGDGGGNDYEIVAAATGAADGGSYIDLTGIAGQAKNISSKKLTVLDFGAQSGVDGTQAAVNSLSALNYIIVPKGFNLVAKNIELNNYSYVLVDGSVSMPDSCSDFDRMFFAVSKSGIVVKANEINGNYSNQSGNIGTHIIYFVSCENIDVDVKYIHDHYISSGATMPSVDGVRNTSSGTVFIYGCENSDVKIGLIEGWGREAVYLQQCKRCNVSLFHAQGVYTTEYSGLQVSGSYNTVSRASVDFAGASGVGFDTINGSISNVISTNTRENSGVNFGHPGFPASGSVADNIVVDRSFGTGISVAGGTKDLSINNFFISSVGDSGVSFTDGSDRGKISSGSIQFPSKWALVSNAASVQAQNIDIESALGEVSLKVSVSSGKFLDGETVTSVGGDAEIRSQCQNLTGNEQRLFFINNIPASYVIGNPITSTGGAIGTILEINIPEEYNESSGGIYARDPRFYPGTGNQIRFPDGTAFYFHRVSCNYTGAGSFQNFTQPFFSNSVWVDPPYFNATVLGGNSTSIFEINKLSVNSTTADFTISLSSNVDQTYIVTATAVGRWK